MATDHDGPTGTRERDTAPAGADAAPTPTADPAVTVEVVPLDTLTPLTDNPRTHTSRGIDFLKASLGRVGAARSGVIDEARTILAGNGMQDAATQVGYREAVVVTTDGTRPVFVQRTGLSTTQKARLIVDDNRASELSAWNPTLATYADQDPSLKADWTRPEWRAAVGRDAPTAGRGNSRRGWLNACTACWPPGRSPRRGWPAHPRSPRPPSPGATRSRP